MKRRWIGIISFLMEYGVLVLICIYMKYSSDFTFRFTFLYLIIQIVFGHYSVKTLLIWEEIRLLTLSHMCFYMASLVLIPVAYLTVEMWLSNLIITTFMFVIDIVLARTIRLLLRNQTVNRVLVIGTGKEAATLESVCKTNRFTMMEIIGFVSYGKGNVVLVSGDCYPGSQLSRLLDEKHIDEVIIAAPGISKQEIDEFMIQLRNKVKRIRYVPLANGLVTFDSKVDDFDGLLVVSSSNEELRLFSRIIKRLLDIAGGIVGCLLLLPLTLYVRHVNRANGDYGPVFFVQERIGKNGINFPLYKFRTMVPNAEKILEELMENNPEVKEEYLTRKKLTKDPRITKAGAFLRKKSLDEFPQLLNVLKGDMSLVGPRPYLPREKEDMNVYYDSITLCKPGITGMWQSHGRSDVGFDERCEMDEYYYRNWNLWLDITILIKTAKGVLKHDGAF